MEKFIVPFPSVRQRCFPIHYGNGLPQSLSPTTIPVAYSFPATMISMSRNGYWRRASCSVSGCSTIWSSATKAFVPCSKKTSCSIPGISIQPNLCLAQKKTASPQQEFVPTMMYRTLVCGFPTQYPAPDAFCRFYGIGTWHRRDNLRVFVCMWIDWH